jgi:hypothetical protein
VVREPRVRRLLGAAAIFLTALVLQRACTLPWASGGEGEVRFRLSVVGLSRHPATGDGPLVACRWWPRYGDAQLCAVPPGAAAAAERLRLAYPLLQVGLWLSIASLLLQALRVPRSWALQALLPAAVAVGALMAVIFVRQGAAHALTSLDGVPMHFAGPGFFAALAAVALAAASATLVASAPWPTATAAE